MDKFDHPLRPICLKHFPNTARYSILGKCGRRWQTYALFEDYPSALEGLALLRRKYPEFYFDIHQLIEF